MTLTRSRSDKVIAGVCGGLARRLGWRSSRLRLAYFLVTLLSAGFPGIIIYLVLWFLMPLAD